MCHTTNTVDDSGISDSSLYTIANNNINLIQRFQQLRPDTESPDDGDVCSDIYYCDKNKQQNKNEISPAIQNPIFLSDIGCPQTRNLSTRNIRIFYKISQSHSLDTCPCRDSAAFNTLAGVKSSYYVCDV